MKKLFLKRDPLCWCSGSSFYSDFRGHHGKSVEDISSWKKDCNLSTPEGGTRLVEQGGDRLVMLEIGAVFLPAFLSYRVYSFLFSEVSETELAVASTRLIT